MNNSDKTDIATESGLSRRINDVGGRLAESFRDLVEALPGHPHRPNELARAFGVDKNVAHRLMTALKQEDPLATVYQIPGPQPLRKVLRTSVERGVSEDLAQAAEDAVSAFDDLIRREGGNRAGLEAIISDWLPDVRPAIENIAKQLAFRGMRQIKGLVADVEYCTTLVHPSEDEGALAGVQIVGYHMLRRVRPRAEFTFDVSSGATNPESVPLTLDGKPARDPRGIILQEFCSDPPPEIELHEQGEAVIYRLNWNDAVGYNSSRDMVIAEVRRKLIRSHRSPDDTRLRAGLGIGMSVPARTYIRDVLMHRDAYPGREPTVRVVEMGAAGAADPNDVTREADVLDVTARVDALGEGVRRFRTAEIPRYTDLLHHVCRKVGWDPEQFRGYRTRLDYPIFGTELQHVFDVPVRSGDGAEG